ASNGIKYTELNDSQQDKIARLILRVKANDDMNAIVQEFSIIVEEMREAGADYFALGCTEIPIIVNAYDFPYPVVDATLELARAAVVKCGYELTEHRF
ncbi:MAG: hypothetical protein LBU94_04265, partial [Clostridiales bacterium]|nr:hypothetical protein [Clostridiales bacterium]